MNSGGRNYIGTLLGSAHQSIQDIRGAIAGYEHTFQIPADSGGFGIAAGSASATGATGATGAASTTGSASAASTTGAAGAAGAASTTGAGARERALDWALWAVGVYKNCSTQPGRKIAPHRARGVKDDAHQCIGLYRYESNEFLLAGSSTVKVEGIGGCASLRVIVLCFRYDIGRRRISHEPGSHECR